MQLHRLFLSSFLGTPTFLDTCSFYTFMAHNQMVGFGCLMSLFHINWPIQTHFHTRRITLYMEDIKKYHITTKWQTKRGGFLSWGSNPLSLCSKIYVHILLVLKKKLRKMVGKCGKAKHAHQLGDGRWALRYGQESPG